MDDALELAAGLLAAVASGKPFETDRERVEHHVRAALGRGRSEIVWEGSMQAATRRLLEMMTSRTRLEIASPLCSSPSWRSRRDVSLTALFRVEAIVLAQGRTANRSSNVTPARRLDVPLWRVEEPVPVIDAVRDLVEHWTEGVVAGVAPRRWKALTRVEPVERVVAELAQAAAAGLFAGYVVAQRGATGGRRVVLVPRPVMRLQSGLTLHADHRPAVEWPDGTQVWYWHGVEIPSRIATRVDTLTPQQIAAIGNQEVRRLVLERVTWDRFLVSATRVAQDDFGTLWDAGVRIGREPVRLVEVVNATAEPDGTHRRYVLRVPPAVRTAREAVAWTFGFERADDYILAAAS